MERQVPKTVFEVRRDARGVSIENRVLGYRAVQLLEFVTRRVAECGQAPSYSEICDELGISNGSKVNRIMKSLERRGALSREWSGTPSSHFARRISIASMGN